MNKYIQSEAQGSSDKFLDSADRCEFFMEPWALDDATGRLREDVTKEDAINKAGHGLHYEECDEVFSRYARSDKVAALARALGWVDPVLPQSMYIFKQARQGGEVTSHQVSPSFLFFPSFCLSLSLVLSLSLFLCFSVSLALFLVLSFSLSLILFFSHSLPPLPPYPHDPGASPPLLPLTGVIIIKRQDSSFLHTTPRLSCLGLWLALEPATLANGCVWGRPGSHHDCLRRIFCRNPQYFEDGDYSQPQMIFKSADAGEQQKTEGGRGGEGRECEKIPDNGPVFPSAPWEGTIPSLPPSTADEEEIRVSDSGEAAVRAAGFVPLECEEGDLVLIHGSVDHLSLENRSGKSRHTFQLHLIEGPSEGVEWSPTNWLQLPSHRKEQGFPRLVMRMGTKGHQL